MSKIFLVSSNTTVNPYPVYPIGISIIASALAAHGHQVSQFDFLVEDQSEERLCKAIADFTPDFVGISLRNIDAVDSFSASDTWYISSNLRVMKAIRGTTRAPVILGGSAFSIMPEEILSYLDADYGIVGEGETAVCSLVSALEQGRSMPPITNNSNVGLSEKGMPYHPLWDSALVDYYRGESGMMGIQTKRGCPYQCTYCTYPAIEGTRVRYKSADDVADEVEALKKAYGVDTFYFTDSIFNDEKGVYLDVAETLVQRDTGIKWSAFFRPDRIGSDELSLLKRSGLYAIETGCDAASDDTLSGLNKQFTFGDVYDFNEACVKARIPCAHYIMFGGPGETDASLKEGLRNIETLKHCMVFGFSGIRIFPQTVLQRQAMEDGVLDGKESLLKPAYYYSPAIDVQTMNEAVTEGFRGRRDRVFPPSDGLEKLKAMNRFGYRGLLWDHLVSFR